MCNLAELWPLYILVIFGTSLQIKEVNGQFTLTGFPHAEKGKTHTLTCKYMYPGATAYEWTSPNGATTAGAVVTLTVDIAKHDGLWKCGATVGGIKKTISENLLVYCSGLYLASASKTNPSIDDRLELFCQLTNPKGGLVQWNQRLFSQSADNGTAWADGKCNIKEGIDNVIWVPGTDCQVSRKSNKYFNIIVKKVRESSAGYWRCIDFGNTGCFSKAVRIDIARPPKDPATIKGFNNPIVGTNHVLTCDAWQPFARPMIYTWYKDGLKISSGNASTWSLKPVVRDAAGKYRCEVVDTIKKVKVQAEDTLEVYYSAIWNPAVEKDAFKRIHIGRSISLTLDILVHPPPTSIDWYFDGNLTSPLNVTTIKQSDTSTTWIMTITSVTMDDYGNYTAKVTNQAGSSLIHYEIARPLPPDMPTDLKVLAQGKTSLAVWFTAGFDGGAPQTFTIEYKTEGKEPKLLEGIKEDGKTKTITYDVTGLLSGVVYYIRVKAVNDIGSSSYTDATKTKTGTGPTGGPKTDGMPIWQLVAIGISALLFLIIIFLVIFFVARRRYKEKPEAPEGTTYAKRPTSSYQAPLPTGVTFLEKDDEDVGIVKVIAEENDLSKIEPVEDIAVSPTFYHDLNVRVRERAKIREKGTGCKARVASRFVDPDLALKCTQQYKDEYEVVDVATRNKATSNDRSSKGMSKLYAAVNFAKKKLKKEQDSGDDKSDGSTAKPVADVGVDGTVYTQVNLSNKRPPAAGKGRKNKKPPEERTEYAQVDFNREAPAANPGEFEMV